MKKILCLTVFIALFSYCSIVKASINDSIELYHYWAKRGIIEMIYAYMKDYDYVADSLKNVEKLGKEHYEKIYIKDIKTFSPRVISEKYNSVPSFLETNGWPSCSRDIFQNLDKQLSNSLPLNKNFFLNCMRKYDNIKDVPIDFIADIDKTNKNIQKYWKQKADSIIIQYNKKLSELSEGIDMSVKSDNGKSSYEIKDKDGNTQFSNKQVDGDQPEENSKTSLVSYLIIAILIVAGFAIGLITGRKLFLNKVQRQIDDILTETLDENKKYYPFLKRVKKINQKNKNYASSVKNKYEKLMNDFNSVEFQLKLEKDKVEKYKKMYEECLDQKEQLRKAVEHLEDRLKKWEHVDANNEYKLIFVPSIASNDVKPPATEVQEKQSIYFSMPEKDGSFQLVNGEEYNDGRKCYKITFERSSIHGVVSFLNGERDQRVINRQETFLLPVCEILNATSSQHAKNIEVLESGKVTLMNDRWVIDSNCKIKVRLY